MGEFRLSQEISHEDSKGSMCRYSGKQSQNASSEPILKNINDVFYRGEPHADDHCVDDSIKRLIEVPVVVEYKPDKNELAEFLNESYFKKCIKELLNNVIFFCEDQKVNWIADKKCNDGAYTTVDETDNEQAKRLSFVLVLQINVKHDSTPGGERKGKQTQEMHLDKLTIQDKWN